MNTEEEIIRQLTEQKAKIEQVYKSVEKIRKYFLWTLIITLAVTVLPAIGLIFVVPLYLKTLNFTGLGL